MNVSSPTKFPPDNSAAGLFTSSAGATDSQTRQKRCQRCLNHGEIRLRQDHACKYKNKYHSQTCSKCELIDLRWFYEKIINDTVAKEILVGDETFDKAPVVPRLKRGARSPTCAACRMHGEIFALRGHKRRCKYSKCECFKCLLVGRRRAVLAAQVKLGRNQRMQQLLQEQKSQQHSADAILPSSHQHLNHHHYQPHRASLMNDVRMSNERSSRNSSSDTPRILSTPRCTCPPQFSSHRLPPQSPEAFRCHQFVSFNCSNNFELPTSRGAVEAAKAAPAHMKALEPLPPFATSESFAAADAMMLLLDLLGIMLPVVSRRESLGDGSTTSSITVDSHNNSPQLSSMNWLLAESCSPSTTDFPNYTDQVFPRTQQRAALLHRRHHANQIQPPAAPTPCEALHFCSTV